MKTNNHAFIVRMDRGGASITAMTEETKRPRGTMPQSVDVPKMLKR